MLTKDFGKRLKYWDEWRRIPPKTFRTGLNSTQILLYETGEGDPTLSMVEEVLNAFDLSIATFFGELPADKPLPETFGERLKYWRERRGLSREELAKLK